MATWKSLVGLVILAMSHAVGARQLAETPPPKCNYLDAMGQLNDLSTIQGVLMDTGVMPENTQDTATLLLPDLIGFVDFLMKLGVGSSEFERALQHDEKLKAQVDSVLMMHVLLGPNITVAEMAANATFPTAASLIFNDSRFDISVRLPGPGDDNLGTITTNNNQDNPAQITQSYKLCNLQAYLINQVLLPLPWGDKDFPETEHWMINDLFANLTAASFATNVSEPIH